MKNKLVAIALVVSVIAFLVSSCERTEYPNVKTILECNVGYSLGAKQVDRYWVQSVEYYNDQRLLVTGRDGGQWYESAHSCRSMGYSGEYVTYTFTWLPK